MMMTMRAWRGMVLCLGLASTSGAATSAPLVDVVHREGVVHGFLVLRSETGETLASLAGCMRKFPQVLVNVPVARKPPIDTLTEVAERIRGFEREMDGTGRILVRYSGTEPLARVMIEGADGDRIRAMADELASAIRRELER